MSCASSPAASTPPSSPNKASAAALQLARGTLPGRGEDRCGGRRTHLPAPTEAAVYFLVFRALANVAKYAQCQPRSRQRRPHQRTGAPVEVARRRRRRRRSTDRLGSPRVGRPHCSAQRPTRGREPTRGVARRSRRRSHARRSSRRARTPGSEAIHPLPRMVGGGRPFRLASCSSTWQGILLMARRGRQCGRSPASVTASWFAAALWIWGWWDAANGPDRLDDPVGNLLADLQVAYPDSRIAWTLGLLGLNVIGAGFFVWWWLAYPTGKLGTT